MSSLFKANFTRPTPTIEKVHIGEHDYEYVQVGNQYWITEDL